MTRWRYKDVLRKPEKGHRAKVLGGKDFQKKQGRFASPLNDSGVDSQNGPVEFAGGFLQLLLFDDADEFDDELELAAGVDVAGAFEELESELLEEELEDPSFCFPSVYDFER